MFGSRYAAQIPLRAASSGKMLRTITPRDQGTAIFNRYAGSDKVPSIFQANHTFQCVVGANTWLVEQKLQDWKVTYWYHWHQHYRTDCDEQSAAIHQRFPSPLTATLGIRCGWLTSF